MNREERLSFVRSHRTAVFGVNRKQDGPAMSIVYYTMDGNDLLVSTMEDRGKAKAVRRSSKVSLCVLDELWPPAYLLLYCDATIDATVDTDLEKFVTQMMSLAKSISGKPVPEEARDNLRQMALRERRVMLRLRPYATFESPPSTAATPRDLDGAKHGLGQILSWE